MAGVDLDADHGSAIPVCRQPVELARTAIGRRLRCPLLQLNRSISTGRGLVASDPKRTQETLVLEFFQSARVNGTIGGFSKRSPSIELYFADAHPK